jgi:dihydrofolate reductase
MKLGLIFARARGGVIGKDGRLPWHLPEDLAHFKQITMGCAVIMGRKTWDSLPERVRPLPGRMNIVITRQPCWIAPGASRAASLGAAIELCDGQPRAWVIGGAEIYTQALPLADRAEVTEIEADIEGDVFFPGFGSQWKELKRERHHSVTGLEYSFVTYQNT